MGGAADLPQRSSSPLKRPASELEAEIPSSQRDDVDMIRVPSVEPTLQGADFAQSVSNRAASVDMLQHERPDNEVTEPAAAATVEGVVPSELAELGIFDIL